LTKELPVNEKYPEKIFDEYYLWKLSGGMDSKEGRDNWRSAYYGVKTFT
jgi:hypothetical protein